MKRNRAARMLCVAEHAAALVPRRTEVSTKRQGVSSGEHRHRFDQCKPE
jgi:hypothetical protein